MMTGLPVPMIEPSRTLSAPGCPPCRRPGRDRAKRPGSDPALHGLGETVSAAHGRPHEGCGGPSTPRTRVPCDEVTGFDRGAISVITSHETMGGPPVRRCDHRVRWPVCLQPQSRRPKPGAARERAMGRRRQLSVGDRHGMQSRDRVWPWAVLPTDHPRRWHLRRRRHLPH
jgi:hypothetical protein